MARIGATFVDVDTLVILGRTESWSALADGFAVLNLAQSIVTFQRVARIDTLERLLVASAVLRTILVLDTVDAETAQSKIVGVAPSSRRASARSLVVYNRTDGIRSAFSGGARIGASLSSALTDQAGQLIPASGASLALVGSHAGFSVTIANSSLTTRAAERSRHVGTLGSRMAGPALAFVHIDTTVESRSVTRSATTLAVTTDLAVGTISIGPTSWPASTVDTDFAGHAVIVTVADLDTVAGQTAFSSHASVGAFATGRVASTGLATLSSRADFSSLTVNRISHTSLLGSWSSHKTYNDFVINYLKLN